MFFAASAYYELGNLNQAIAIMQEVIGLKGEMVGEAQDLLKQWEE